MKYFFILCSITVCFGCIDDNLCECFYAVPDENFENGQRMESINYNCEIGPPQPCI